MNASWTTGQRASSQITRTAPTTRIGSATPILRRVEGAGVMSATEPILAGRGGTVCAVVHRDLRREMRQNGQGRSVVEDDRQQRGVDLEGPVVVDEAESAEFVHEEVHPRPGRAD